MAKIMLIDDEEIIRLLCQEELEDSGYDVVSIESPENWEKDVLRERPDLLILDVKFEGYDGFQVCENMKKRFPNLPIILYSAADYRSDVKSISADYYVIKNYDLGELKTTVKTCLEKRV
jgi:DNA-binding response OmpR family regulator